MINIEKYMLNIRKYINPMLFQYVTLKKTKINKILIDAMIYSLMIGGKRIRPILLISSAMTAGKSVRKFFPVACAIEMIHTYSLIHDDLPFMDDDSLRRGNLTCHKQFDEAAAILAGNALLTLGFEILINFGLTNGSIKSNVIFDLIKKITISIGCNGMLNGQMMDIVSEKNKLSYTNLKKMHLFKTGKLIEISIISGAILVGSNEKELKQLKKYGNNLGLAFQVSDDILNVTGNYLRLGKPVGSDNAKGKNTYPSILGLKNSRKFLEKLIDNAITSLNIFDNKANILRRIAKYILERTI